jgi:hypothetical protein
MKIYKIYNEETQKVIDFIVKQDENINFKICTKCKRNLPCHDWFYAKHKNGKFGRDSECKECQSSEEHEGKYKFENYLFSIEMIDINLFINNYRKMSINQLMQYYNVSLSQIKKITTKLNLNKFQTVETLKEEEIIFMYESLRHNEINSFINGIFKNENNIILLIRYLINNILKWDRIKICMNLNSQTFANNNLASLFAIKGFDIYKYINKSFADYKIMPWELQSSSVGNNFWNDKTINNALLWLKNKLKEDKNIDNIHQAGVYGFKNIVKTYNLDGLCTIKFKSNNIIMLESVFNEKYNKIEMLKINYKLKNFKEEIINRKQENIIYKILDEYYNLDNIGKKLINSIICFCENEKRFPVEKDLKTKNNYIGRKQYYKYFGEESWTSIYNYIIPLQQYRLIAFDNTFCDSLEELKVYEFLKKQMNLTYIINNSQTRSGKFIYYPKSKKYNKFCPDFAIEYINYNNKKIKLLKPIIIEYYGMYDNKSNNEIWKNYRIKTKYKNKFYKSINNIIFIDLYSMDLKNNYEGIKNKIDNIIKTII